MRAIKIDVVEKKVHVIELDDTDILLSIRREIGSKVERIVCERSMRDVLFVDGNPPENPVGWFRNVMLHTPIAGHGVIINKTKTWGFRPPKSVDTGYGGECGWGAEFLEHRNGKFYAASPPDVMHVVDQIEDSEAQIAEIKRRFEAEIAEIQRRFTAALAQPSQKLQSLQEELVGLKPGDLICKTHRYNTTANKKEEDGSIYRVKTISFQQDLGFYREHPVYGQYRATIFTEPLQPKEGVGPHHGTFLWDSRRPGCDWWEKIESRKPTSPKRKFDADKDH